MKLQTELIMHKTLIKCIFGWHGDILCHYDIIIVLRSSIGLKLGNFPFWSSEAEIWLRGVFLSCKFKFLLKTIDKHQFDLKMMI